MRYRLIVQYFSFMSMTVDPRPEYERVYRWKWLARLNEFLINTAPRGCLGMFTAHVVEEGKK